MTPRLAALTLSGDDYESEISPSFSPDTLNYTAVNAHRGAGSITITPTTEYVHTTDRVRSAFSAVFTPSVGTVSGRTLTFNNRDAIAVVTIKLWFESTPENYREYTLTINNEAE